jgi:hypothetical protein
MQHYEEDKCYSRKIYCKLSKFMNTFVRILYLQATTEDIAYALM